MWFYLIIMTNVLIKKPLKKKGKRSRPTSLGVRNEIKKLPGTWTLYILFLFSNLSVKESALCGIFNDFPSRILKSNLPNPQSSALLCFRLSGILFSQVRVCHFISLRSFGVLQAVKMPHIDYSEKYYDDNYEYRSKQLSF